MSSRHIRRTSSFKKDFKLLSRRGKDMRKLEKVVELLVSAPVHDDGRVELPAHYRNHKLTGNFSGSWDCHIEPDWVLVYRMEPGWLILEYTGRHADIFND